ncbi:MAG: hypothetical protein RL181_282 [Bacteroidota bacterium]|jgi:hypothetical protein
MARGLKLTGFARFFILMLVLAPLAYIIASYANGQDGVANIKRLLGMEQRTESAEGSPSVPLFGGKKEQIQRLESQVDSLEEALRARDLEIARLKGMLER